ncbi:MAG: hypothetical protein H6819_01305 [Phycisphaerales bacterium]|nr:hypothetical protein [Phycisphaerales bacterium]MCB9857155.1 hypothetical protein [Phycisphaerales bacterium]MCB9861718.1 hypothetical protein [Phycisphaerales bacterium]
MSDYDVSRTAGTCYATGREFSEDEYFYSVILETATGFERRDYAIDAWEGAPTDAVCHFKTRMPRKEAPKRTFVDDTVLQTFFNRLEGTTEPAKQRFRFVLALILLRKRILRYENSHREGDGELWIMRQIGDRKKHEVYNPGLSEDEIGEVTSQLGAVLHADFASDAEDAENAADENNAADDAGISDESAPNDEERASAVGEEARS